MRVLASLLIVMAIGMTVYKNYGSVTTNSEARLSPQECALRVGEIHNMPIYTEAQRIAKARSVIGCEHVDAIPQHWRKMAKEQKALMDADA